MTGIEQNPLEVERHFVFPPPPRKSDEAAVERPIEAPPPVKLIVPIMQNETIRALEPDPPGAQIDYGGRPAFIGADVWYIHSRGEGIAARYIAVPCKLFERFARGHEKWNLSVLWHPAGAYKKMIGVGFSEKPEHGHWCWPIVPAVASAHDISALAKLVNEQGQRIAALEAALTEPN